MLQNTNNTNTVEWSSLQTLIEGGLVILSQGDKWGSSNANILERMNLHFEILFSWRKQLFTAFYCVCQISLHAGEG